MTFMLLIRLVPDALCIHFDFINAISPDVLIQYGCSRMACPQALSLLLVGA